MRLTVVKRKGRVTGRKALARGKITPGSPEKEKGVPRAEAEERKTAFKSKNSAIPP